MKLLKLTNAEITKAPLWFNQDTITMFTKEEDFTRVYTLGHEEHYSYLVVEDPSHITELILNG